MPKLIHQETMCCGHKRCPEIKIFDDGSVELSDNDTGAPPVKLNPEQVARFVELAQKKES